MNWPFDIPIDTAKEETLLAYADELRRVNRQFNLVSRRDEEWILMHHVGHCLAFGLRPFMAGTSIVDWGSGGGLPAIPISILQPDIAVTAVDSNSKKTRSIDLFCRRLKVSNCTSWHGRAEEYAGSAHCSVSRATAPLTDLWTWHERMAAPPRQHTPSDSTGTTWPDGLVCLKGGDLSAEVGQLQIDYPGVEIEDIRLKDFASGSYFATKSIIVVVKRQ